MVRLAAVLFLLLLGCAELTKPNYTWRLVYPSAKVTNWWYVENRELFNRICKPQDTMFIQQPACAVLKFDGTCDIFTRLTEIELSFIRDLDGMPIKEHEEKHCQGWMHNEIEVR